MSKKLVLLGSVLNSCPTWDGDVNGDVTMAKIHVCFLKGVKKLEPQLLLILCVTSNSTSASALSN